MARRPRDLEAFEDELDGGSEVLRATRRGEIDRLREILTRRPRDVEASGHMGRRPLHIAVDVQNIALVRFLLQAGAEVDARRERGDTPLYWARDAATATLLIEAGASVHALDFSEREPIHWAAQFARPDVLQVLLEHGCAVDVRDLNGNTPLHWATGTANMFGDVSSPSALECVRVLLEWGADVDARGIDGRVPLCGVARMPDMSRRLHDGTRRYAPEMPEVVLGIVRLLLGRGADPQIRDAQGHSPLDMACDQIRAVMEASQWHGRTRH